MSMFTMPPSWQQLSPLHDDRVAYEIAMEDCERQARIAAFGAIRRAAAEARSWDSIKGGSAADPVAISAMFAASQIRAAIRAAIGSDKA